MTWLVLENNRNLGAYLGNKSGRAAGTDSGLLF
jgi:hypothetical protein